MGKKLLAIINTPRTIFGWGMYLLNKKKSLILMDIDAWEDYLPKCKSTFFKMSYLLTNYKAFRNIFLFRLTKGQRFFLRILFQPLESLELGGNVGGGLKIYHGYASVIQPASMGEQCSIWQNVTIGRRPKKGKFKDKPTIGNTVNIYTGAIVIGDIYIGNNVEIGAGAIVTKDVPDNSIVIGNPMRIIKRD